MPPWGKLYPGCRRTLADPGPPVGGRRARARETLRDHRSGRRRPWRHRDDVHPGAPAIAISRAAWHHGGVGDAWRDEEVARTLRLFEWVGRADIPVVPGGAFPLVRTQQPSRLWEQQFGKVPYQGAWTRADSRHDPFQVPPLKEGNPTTKPLDDDAAHLLARMVPRPHGRQPEPAHPRPGIRRRPKPRVQSLVRPRSRTHPPASPPSSIVSTTVDVSVRTRLSRAVFDGISKSLRARPDTSPNSPRRRAVT